MRLYVLTFPSFFWYSDLFSINQNNLVHAANSIVLCIADCLFLFHSIMYFVNMTIFIQIRVNNYKTFIIKKSLFIIVTFIVAHNLFYLLLAQDYLITSILYDLSLFICLLFIMKLKMQDNYLIILFMICNIMIRFSAVF